VLRARGCRTVADGLRSGGSNNRTVATLHGPLAPVARFDPNLNGLFDMSGNVYEWTADAFDSTAYAGAARTDPHITGDGVTRVVLGGT